MTDSYKSFQYVEEKLAEAIFFLQKMQESDTNIFALRCYFSAFVSAARSVTFVLQFVLGKIDGFDQWYEKRRKEMQENEIMRFFLDRRNEALKEGITSINSGKFYKDERGQPVRLYFFTNALGHRISETDVYTSSKKYIQILEELVKDCKRDFAKYADPDWWFSMKNLESEKLTIEDLEEKIGFPRGWTSLVPQEERLRVLSETTPPSIPQIIIDKIKGRII